MEFRLTYAGGLLAYRGEEPRPARSRHVHYLRREFHQQLKTLWSEHPVLRDIRNGRGGSSGALTLPPYDPEPMARVIAQDGFNWLPMVTEANGLICKLDILMLRHGQLGRVVLDVDNRLKTLFDALRRARTPKELGAATNEGQIAAEEDEDPFYVLLDDDKLITHVSVTTDTLLQPVPKVSPERAVRLVIGVTVQPYHAHLENSVFI